MKVKKGRHYSLLHTFIYICIHIHIVTERLKQDLEQIEVLDVDLIMPAALSMFMLHYTSFVSS